MAHGGKRKGAGRKPVKDKRVQLDIYPLASTIRKVGGKTTARVLALRGLEELSAGLWNFDKLEGITPNTKLL